MKGETNMFEMAIGQEKIMEIKQMEYGDILLEALGLERREYGPGESGNPVLGYIAKYKEDSTVMYTVEYIFEGNNLIGIDYLNGELRFSTTDLDPTHQERIYYDSFNLYCRYIVESLFNDKDFVTTINDPEYTSGFNYISIPVGVHDGKVSQSMIKNAMCTVSKNGNSLEITLDHFKFTYSEESDYYTVIIISLDLNNNDITYIQSCIMKFKSLEFRTQMRETKNLLIGYAIDYSDDSSYLSYKDRKNITKYQRRRDQ